MHYEVFQAAYVSFNNSTDLFLLDVFFIFKGRRRRRSSSSTTPAGVQKGWNILEYFG
jgi:hypothetical protein